MSVPSNPVSNELSTFNTTFVSPKDGKYEPSFLEKTGLYEKIIGIATIAIGIAMLEVRFRYLPNLAKPLYNVTGFASYFVIGVGLFRTLDNSYYNHSFRKEQREQLENGQITIEDFIQKHSWERIVYFGFLRADEHEPLITKKHFVDYANKALENLDQGFNDTFDTNNFIYPITKTPLWSCLEYKLFSKEQTVKLEQEFQQRIKTINSYSLVKNWKTIQLLGWDQHFSMSMQKTLNELHSSYIESKTIYMQKLNEHLLKLERKRSLLLREPYLWCLYLFCNDFYKKSYFEHSILSLDSRALKKYYLLGMQEGELSKRDALLAIRADLFTLKKALESYEERLQQELETTPSKNLK